MSAVAITPEPRIRSMHWEDLPAVLRIEELAYEFPWTLSIFRDCLRVGYACCVLEAPSGVIGYGLMSVGAGECHLLNICVHPEYQRRGLGARLVEHLLAEAQRRGVRMALLEVRVSNTAAYCLYQKLGFDEVGLRKDYYPARQGREDAILLARELHTYA
ncbi:MAG: ribosomal protein S18-alanine N-acetyltransferase [Pseudomonadota bacterium]